MISNGFPVATLDFPPANTADAKKTFAEYAILGGMLQAEERFIRSGANVDWDSPMSEAIARACVEAWEHCGADTDEGWRCAVGAYLTRYTGRSPLLDSPMLSWCAYLMGIYRLQFGKGEVL